MHDNCIWYQRWCALGTAKHCAHECCAHVTLLTHCAGCDTHWCDEHAALHTGCGARNGHFGRYALPNDVFVLILSHLYGPDLARWRRTCKHFYALIQGERELRERVSYVVVLTSQNTSNLCSTGTTYIEAQTFAMCWDLWRDRDRKCCNQRRF